MRHVQLRAFHNVALTGGFSRAAEALNLTQPAISDQVRRLEEAYDVLLFDRRGRRVVPTAAGERLFAITRRLFAVEREAADLLGEARALRAGHLRIVADAPHHLLHILAAFRGRHPGVRVTMRSANSAGVAEALHGYAADVGVMGELPDDPALAGAVLSSAPIVAFAARGSPLAQRESVGLEDLARMPLVMREHGSKTRAKMDSAAEAAGIVLVPAVEAEGREAVREIVAAGGGVGFVSRAEFGADPRLVPVPIVLPRGAADPLRMEEALVFLRQRREGKLVRAFLATALEVVPEARGF